MSCWSCRELLSVGVSQLGAQSEVGDYNVDHVHAWVTVVKSQTVVPQSATTLSARKGALLSL